VSGYYNQSDSYDDESQDNTGSGLRKQLEKALEEIADLRKAQQKTTATDVLKDAGIDPALADLVPKDADPKEWVAQYGPLLGARPKTFEDDPAPAAEHVEGAADSGSSSVYSTDVIERMSKIDNEDELMKFFNSNGAL
jgi:hypothetical protein